MDPETYTTKSEVLFKSFKINELAKLCTTFSIIVDSPHDVAYIYLFYFKVTMQLLQQINYVTTPIIKKFNYEAQLG